MTSFPLNEYELQKIRDFLGIESLEIHLSPDFSSDKTGFREKIKAELAKFQLHSQAQKSISHTNTLGGFALTQDPIQLGFDLEISDRVRPEIIRRMSTQKEVDEAPSPAHLWCAKEAVFKALVGATQPQIISELHIGNWQKTESQIETYCLLNLQNFKFSNGRGCIVQKNQLTMGIFALRP